MPLVALVAFALVCAPIPQAVADPVSPSRVGDGVSPSPEALPPCLVDAVQQHLECVRAVDPDGPQLDALALCALQLVIHVDDCEMSLEEFAMHALRTLSTVLWRWQAPEPVAADPTLTIRAGADAIAGVPVLQATVAPATVDSISDDRRRLTLTAAIVGATTRAAGEGWGEAFLVTPAGGTFPVRVSEVSDDADVVTLADPLPRRVDVTGATVQWASWWTTFSAADVTATTRRDVHWDVSWQPLHAGAAAVEATTQVDEGRLVVAKRPFSTRVTEADLVREYSDLGSTTPGRDNGRQGVLQAAHDLLVLDLRPHLRPRGLWEHDIDGGNLAPAHKALAAALIVDRTDPDRAERLRRDYHSRFKLGLRAVWADLNADGKVDPGEEVEVTGAVTLAPQRLSGLFASVAEPSAPSWPRGRPR